MKRPIALLISAGVTALILIVVLAVASTTTDAVQADAQQQATASSELSSDPAVLQEQLRQAYALMQQRDSIYQERLQEAYTQLEQTQSQSDDRYEYEEEGREHEGRELEFTGAVEAVEGNTWTIAGQIVQVTSESQIKSGIGAGSHVQVHARVQEDGTLWAREIEHTDD
jgi:hypothetical protein